MAYGERKLASTFDLGDRIVFCRGIKSNRSPILSYGTIYRKTKNFVYAQTTNRKVKFDADAYLTPLIEY